MKKLLCFTRKTLLEYLREPQLLVLLLVTPPFMVIIFYYAFGGASDRGLDRLLHIYIDNQDQGAFKPGGEIWQGGNELVEVIRQSEYEGKPVFNLSLVPNHKAAHTSIREGRAALLLVIPHNYSQALLEARITGRIGQPASLSMVGDTSSLNYVFAQGFLEDVVREFSMVSSGRQETLVVSYEFLPGTGTMSDFDFSVPGVINFSILMVMISTATTLARENVHNTLQRLRLTRITAAHLLRGVGLAQILIAALQIPLAYGTAIAFGFGRGEVGVEPDVLLLAMGIGLLFSAAVVGLGLIVAAFSRNEGDATNLASIALIPVAFLSGSLFPMPAFVIGSIGGHPVSIYDLLPAAPATEAMRRVLVFGEGGSQIIYELSILSLLVIIYLVVGIVLYDRLRIDIRGKGLYGKYRPSN